MEEPLYIYAVFNTKTLDFPGFFVARKFYNKKNGTVVADPLPFMTTPYEEDIHVALSQLGKYRLPREANDDPNIICTYI